MSRVTKFMDPSARKMSVTPQKILRMSVVFAGVIVTGCASYERDHFTVGSVPSDYRTTHPIVVSQSEVSQDMVVARGMKGMSFRQKNTATYIAGRYKRSGARTLRVIIPSGSHNAEAARIVGRELVAHLQSQGIKPSNIRVSRYHAANHGDAATIRISYEATAANVASKCGQWNEDVAETSQNRNYGNFGCATQNNLAKIIANPEDLLGPRGESEIDATRRDNVIDDWRTNGTPSLPSLL